jgi:hypothetical protein
MHGAYLVTCHSGVTLAAAHARFQPEWLAGTAAAPDPEALRDPPSPIPELKALPHVDAAAREWALAKDATAGRP